MSERLRRIESGDLPYTLEGASWTLYVGSTTLLKRCNIPDCARTEQRWSQTGWLPEIEWRWDDTFWKTSWCRMWFNITYVRMQAFERDAEAEWAAEELWMGCSD